MGFQSKKILNDGNSRRVASISIVLLFLGFSFGIFILRFLRSALGASLKKPPSFESLGTGEIYVK